MKSIDIKTLKQGIRRIIRTSPRTMLLVAIIPILLISLWLARPAKALVTFQSTSTAENGTGTGTLAINTPPTATRGDVLVAVITVKGGTGTTITPPTNWTLRTTNDSTTNIKSATYTAYYYPGQANAVGLGAQTFTFSVAGKAAGVISSYSGVDRVDVVDVSGSQSNASLTTMTAPSVTTTQPNTMLVAAYGSGTNTTFTAGSSMNLRAQATSSGGGGATTKVTTAIQDIVQAGTGATGTKTMTAASGAVNVGHLLALRAMPDISQAAYRFFQNTNSTTVGTPYAAINTAATIPKDTPFRLRINLGVASGGTNATAVSGRGFYVQYSLRGSDGACDTAGTGETYVSVDATSPIRFYDNATPVDGAAYVADAANDPIRSGVTAVNQKYEEAYPLSAASTIPAGQDGLWDLALSTTGASYGATYCIRVTNIGDNTDLLPAGYSVIPQVTIPTPTVSQANYRWMTNADSATPGAPLAAQDVSATVASQTTIRLRQRLAVNNSPIPINYANYKLQYAEKVGVCDVGFSGETYVDAVPTTNFSTTINNNESVDDGGTGSDITWLNGANAWGINNGLTATHSAPLATGITTSTWLRSQGYSANIPTTATITGIEAYVIAAGNTTSDAMFIDVRLARAGVRESVGKNPNTAIAGTAYVSYVFGSPTDLWGASWTPADVNSYYFGSTIRTQLTAQGSFGNVDIDAFQMKIYYTDSGGATGAIAYFNNPTPADLSAISSSGSDPTNGARPTVYQSYRETDPFTNNVATIPDGSDGLWDFSISSSAAAAGKTYCFRVVKSGGSLLDSYAQIPEVTISAPSGGATPTTDQKLRGGQTLQNGVKSPIEL